MGAQLSLGVIMKPITLKKQNLKNSCMSACIAMIADCDVTKVEEEFNTGFQNHTIKPADYCAKVGVTLIRNDERYRAMPGKLYILTVPSLNSPAMFHAVVLDWRDGENPKLYDPSTKLTYSLDPVEPGETNLISWIIDYEVAFSEGLEWGARDGN